MKKTLAYLYRWTEVSTGRWYVGSRTARGCHPFDGYICSSKTVKPMIQEAPDNWKREILAIGDPDYIFSMESAYLQKTNAKSDAMSFNRHNNDRRFGFVNEQLPAEVKDRISQSLKGKKKPARTAEHKKKLSDARKGKTAWNKGLTKTSDERVAANAKGISSSKKGKPGHKQSIETRSKIAATEKATKQYQKSVESLQRVDVYREKQCVSKVNNWRTL